MYYNPNQGIINQLERQKDNIDNLLNQYSTPVQNIINTGSEYDVKFLKPEEEITNVDFYVVMNMAWNDYKSVLGESVDNYVKFTKAFIKDEDAPEDKVYMYFTKVV